MAKHNDGWPSIEDLHEIMRLASREICDLSITQIGRLNTLSAMYFGYLARAELQRRQSQWVPVSERLPAERREVWVRAVVDGKTMHFSGMLVGSQWIAVTEHVTLTGDCDCSDGDIIDAFASQDVTHWMPLPEPPTC